MGSIHLLAGGFTFCLFVCLSWCDVNEDNYDTLLEKFKNPLRINRGGFYLRHGDDHFQTESGLKDECCRDKEHVFGQSSFSEGEDHFEEAVVDTASDRHDEDSGFVKGFRDMKNIYDKCQKKIIQRRKKLKTDKRFKEENALFRLRENVMFLYSCMKVFSFRRLDEFLSDDVVPVSRYLEFVKDLRNGSGTVTATNPGIPRMYAADILNKNWINLIEERIEKFLKEHSLKFRLNENLNEGRGRRRDHRMFAMMMMGFVIMASILVPMGFQFLTVLGGKSLLMAKMALVMSAINGLKKIATSNVGYGLYHAGPETFHHDPHHHTFHDKIFHIKAQEQPDSPFNVVI